jgi:hypothetical protein
MNARRTFLSFLAASPLYAGVGFFSRSFAQTAPPAAADDLVTGARNLREITHASVIRPA